MYNTITFQMLFADGTIVEVCQLVDDDCTLVELAIMMDNAIDIWATKLGETPTECRVYEGDDVEEGMLPIFVQVLE